MIISLNTNVLILTQAESLIVEVNLVSIDNLSRDFKLKIGDKRIGIKNYVLEHIFEDFI